MEFVLPGSQVARLGRKSRRGRIRQNLNKMRKGYVYVLLSKKDGRTYTGSTDNLERRIKEHNRGKSKATRNRRPLNLIYAEEFESLAEARAREKFFKSKIGRQELRKIFNNLHIAR